MSSNPFIDGILAGNTVADRIQRRDRQNHLDNVQRDQFNRELALRQDINQQHKDAVARNNSLQDGRVAVGQYVAQLNQIKNSGASLDDQNAQAATLTNEFMKNNKGNPFFASFFKNNGGFASDDPNVQHDTVAPVNANVGGKNVKGLVLGSADGKSVQTEGRKPGGVPHVFNIDSLINTAGALSQEIGSVAGTQIANDNRVSSLTNKIDVTDSSKVDDLQRQRLGLSAKLQGVGENTQPATTTTPTAPVATPDGQTTSLGSPTTNANVAGPSESFASEAKASNLRKDKARIIAKATKAIEGLGEKSIKTPVSSDSASAESVLASAQPAFAQGAGTFSSAGFVFRARKDSAIDSILSLSNARAKEAPGLAKQFLAQKSVQNDIEQLKNSGDKSDIKKLEQYDKIRNIAEGKTSSPQQGLGAPKEQPVSKLKTVPQQQAVIKGQIDFLDKRIAQEKGIARREAERNKKNLAIYLKLGTKFTPQAMNDLIRTGDPAALQREAIQARNYLSGARLSISQRKAYAAMDKVRRSDIKTVTDNFVGAVPQKFRADRADFVNSVFSGFMDDPNLTGKAVARLIDVSFPIYKKIKEDTGQRIGIDEAYIVNKLQGVPEMTDVFSDGNGGDVILSGVQQFMPDIERAKNLIRTELPKASRTQAMDDYFNVFRKAIQQTKGDVAAARALTMQSFTNVYGAN